MPAPHTQVEYVILRASPDRVSPRPVGGPLGTRTVLIVGAGIAGLAAAIGLHRRGHHVTLVERSAELHALGAGVVLQPNALAALRDVGVETDGLGHPIGQAVIADVTGRALQTTDFFAGPHGDSLGVYRPDLCDRLAASASRVPTLLSTTLDGLTEGPDGVDVVLSDGTHARFDLVLACDGLRSRTRALSLGGQGPTVEYSGYTCWRAILPNPGVHSVVEMWGRGRRVGLVPLNHDRVYLFLVANAEPHAPPRDAEALRAEFADFQGAAPPVLAALDDRSLLHHDIEALSGVHWGSPRVWLLGDAAHAMTPNLGQGAGLALEDACTAVRALRASSDVRAAWRALVKARDARATSLMRRSRLLGLVAQWESDWARSARDLMLRLTPASATARSLGPVVSWRPGDGLAP